MKRTGSFLFIILFVFGLASCGTVEKCPAFIGSIESAQTQSHV
ncbi:MAG: hypothetical protein P8I92_01515 [Schleiferiaceae bacterium]|nr:hypothetical protein [Schleiferiaceae bacterium]